MWRSFVLQKQLALTQTQINVSKHLGCLMNPQQNFATINNSNNRPVFIHDNKLVSLNTISQRFQSDTSLPVSGSSSSKSELPKFEKGKQADDDTKKKPKESRVLLNVLGTILSGALVYYGIVSYLEYKRNKPRNFDIDYSSLNLPGLIKPSKTVIRERNPGNVKLTLYQFTTCPFCCKVRAYLDYFGYSYDIVEVNSLTKKQLNWSPDYKGVPVLAVQIPSKVLPDEYEKEIVQLIDSSVIVSAMETYRLDPSFSLKEIVKYFQPVVNEGKLEYNNKYFVMLYNDKLKEGKTTSERKLERDWRSWVDSKFVHVISPNCYRTFGEAVETFRWFEKAGEWEKEFNGLERAMMVYVGSFVMWLIAMKLKKKYELRENVRDSFDDCSEEWISTLDSKSKFKGGQKPNLADLALYGSMGSFEGCQAFEDMMKHEKIKSWFLEMKELVTHSAGSVYLNNTITKN